MNFKFLHWIFLGLMLATSHVSEAQCTMYHVFVQIDAPCSTSGQISWQLIGQDGTLWLSGGASFDEQICLPDGCYTLNMLDTGGNGWECVDWFIEDLIGDFSFDTNLPIGNFGTDQFELGTGNCAGGGGGQGGGNGCPVGTAEYTISVTDGADPASVSWTLTLSGLEVVSGGADQAVDLCLADGCYVLEMFDASGNGWSGAEYEFINDANDVLAAGSPTDPNYDFIVITIGNADCTGVTPGGGGNGGGGGGNPGSGCGSLAPSSDCATAPCVCDNYTFPITPSGPGTFADIPPPGSVSNPSFGSTPPWGGTDFGCLLAGELNPYWMVFTIATNGTLQFSLGQNSNGGQFGFYDWALWPYNGITTCQDIAGNAQPPVRCLWNATASGGTGLASTIPTGGNAGNYGPPLNVTAGQQYILCMSNYSFVTANVVLDFFGTATIQCASILPVSFISLDAYQHGDAVEVDWTTITESNCDYFEIQRSSDAYNWEVIGKVGGHGNASGPLNYAFIDDQPLMGVSYYRIREVDYNGAFQLTEPVDVNLKQSQILLYPNPAGDRVKVSGARNADLTIYDASGRLVYHEKVSDQPTTEINTSEFQEGAYFVSIVTQGSSNFATLLIQHH